MPRTRSPPSGLRKKHLDFCSTARRRCGSCAFSFSPGLALVTRLAAWLEFIVPCLPSSANSRVGASGDQPRYQPFANRGKNGRSGGGSFFFENLKKILLAVS
jgi:hypothetical protein